MDWYRSLYGGSYGDAAHQRQSTQIHVTVLARESYTRDTTLLLRDAANTVVKRIVDRNALAIGDRKPPLILRLT